MSGQMVGADVEQLRSLSRQFDDMAGSAESIRDTLTRTVSSAGWQGGDASAFRADWEGRHRLALAAAIGSLRAAAQTVRQQAEQQERTSAADGAGSGGWSGSGSGASPSVGGDSRASDYVDDLNELKLGEIGVRKVSDGPPRYVVLLRGMEIDGFGSHNDAFNAGTDFVGMESGYQRAIGKALNDAGVPEGDHVEIAMIGYSQGGMAAIEYAGGDSRVKDLVIVGSPVGHKSVPSTVESSVSLVNEDDWIPRIDNLASALVGPRLGANLGTLAVVTSSPLGVAGLAAREFSGPQWSQRSDAPPEMRFTSDHSGDEHSLVDNYRSALKHADGRESSGVSVSSGSEKGTAALSRFAERYAPTYSAEGMRIYGS